MRERKVESYVLLKRNAFNNLGQKQKRKLQQELGLAKLCQITHMPEGKLQMTSNYYFSILRNKFVILKPPPSRLSS